MIPKGNGFNQSGTASCCCARTLWRFLGWPAMARDGEVIQIFVITETHFAIQSQVT